MSQLQRTRLLEKIAFLGGMIATAIAVAPLV